MRTHFITAVLVILILDFIDSAVEVTTKNLVKKHGYPFEDHTVETEDGYILGLHRIPNLPSATETSHQNRPVAFLMHGLAGSSSDWVVLGPKKGLAFLLSDKGYDVWMGNARGNTYSRKHVRYNPDTLIGDFWDFTWHEIGTKDHPALIDYIREKTGRNNMTYVGHSQGATAFFVMSSLNETYQSYIKSVHLMSPLAFLHDLEKFVLEVASGAIGLINPLPNFAESMEFKPNGKISKVAGKLFCDQEPHELCSNILFLLTGFDNNTVEPSILSDVTATTPAGASTKCFLHYFQLHDSKLFAEYYYGFIGNLRRYRSIKPPSYPLYKINVPIFLYYGERDRWIHQQDIDRISESLGNFKGVVLIKGAAHLSPVYQSDVEKVYDLILDDFDSM